MKKDFGWYEERGRGYHVAQCSKCEASVQATRRQRMAYLGNWLSHLDAIIPCCEKPNYHFCNL